MSETDRFGKIDIGSKLNYKNKGSIFYQRTLFLMIVHVNHTMDKSAVRTKSCSLKSKINKFSVKNINHGSVFTLFSSSYFPNFTVSKTLRHELHNLKTLRQRFMKQFDR